MKKNYKLIAHDLGLQKGFFAALITGTLLASQGLNAQTYCSNPAGSTYDDEIFNVTFGSLNNTSACGAMAGAGSQPGQYSNYTSPQLPATNLTMGVNYPLSVTVGQCNGYSYSGYVGVWIDFNQNGSFTDPGEQIYMSGYNNWAVSGTIITANGGITIPLTATAGTTRMRVIASEGSQPTPCGYYSYGETEDYSVNLIPATPCNNTPGANSIVAPTVAICPNTSAFLTLGTTYTVGGISYQWASGTNSVGPFTSIASGTNASYPTPSLTASTWYQVTATCANGGTATVISAVQVSVAPTTTNSVPYLESFNGPPSLSNALPNCSWVRTNTVNCKTSQTGAGSNRQPRTGNGYANFDYGNTGTTNTYYFYSNGVQLNAGVTYSAFVWYISPGYSAWSNFSLKYGPNQSTTGLTTLASINSPANNAYSSLSNTFQVATSGIYYLGISATDNYGYSYFTFDDVGIIAPCNNAQNAVNLTLNAPATICSGQTANLIAAGAATYSWNTTATSPSIAVTPTANSTYAVVGTNTLSNCSLTLTAPITVNPVPPVSIFTPTDAVCEGQSMNLFAVGANSYTWNISTTPNMAMNVVTPTTSTTYSVVGINSYGCSSYASQLVNVYPTPSITVSGNTMICVGEPANLSAFGGATYQWAANSLYLVAPSIAAYPTINTTYTVIGTDANGCVGSNKISVTVNACTGIKEQSASIMGLNVYPNPNNGEFTVETAAGISKTIDVVDVTGRTVLSSNNSDNLVKFNMNGLANGVYYVKVKSGNNTEVLKVVKQ